jgi:hypothetical protein
MPSRAIAPLCCVSSRKHGPACRKEHAVLLLSQGLSYQLDDDTVVLDVPESSDIASPAKIGPRATSGKARKVEQ